MSVSSLFTRNCGGFLRTCSQPIPRRGLATTATARMSDMSASSVPDRFLNPLKLTYTYKADPAINTTTPYEPASTVPVTIHGFPDLEPLSLESYSKKHLHLPLRRDLLHLAVVYEADKARQGTASTKTRWEVAGSHRKLAPQKGSGRARVGTRQSPIRRGGGVAHGPKPRDFATGLNRKVYDVAWRTALSYRYRKGQLVVCEDGMELPLPDEFVDLVAADSIDPELASQYRSKWVEQVMDANKWGRESGRTLFVTGDRRPLLFDTMMDAGKHGRAMEVSQLSVRDLLMEARVVIEREALKELLQSHQSDLVSKIWINGVAPSGPPIGETVVE